MADHEHTSDSCHEIELHKLCRVCARKINKGYKHKCSASGSLLGPFGVRISCDKPDTHPIFYCHNCHTIAKHLEKDRASETTLMAHNWSGHSDHECEVCCMSSSLHVGGRKKKDHKKRGRPSQEGNKGIANAILREAPASWKANKPLLLSRFLPPSTNLTLSDFQCAICLNIVDRPIMTPCRKLLCTECISEKIRTSLDVTCPSCTDTHTITSTSFTPASEVVLKVIEGLLLHCDQPSCTVVLELKNLKQHVNSGCTATPMTFSPSKLTVGQIMAHPLSSSPTSAEQKAAAKVVQRLMHKPAPGTETPSSPVIKLTTHGTVNSVILVY